MQTIAHGDQATNFLISRGPALSPDLSQRSQLEDVKFSMLLDFITSSLQYCSHISLRPFLGHLLCMQDTSSSTCHAEQARVL